MPDGMRKVMLVEDSEDYAFIITRALNHSRRFQIVWRARDGQEAIAYLGGAGQFNDRERFPYPEAVLLDIGLPKKDGFEVLEWMKQQKQKPKVVMLSVLKQEATQQKALNAGADEFKEKPYEEGQFREFVRWLDEWIGQSASATNAESPPRTRRQKSASRGKRPLRGLARNECEEDRHRR